MASHAKRTSRIPKRVLLLAALFACGPRPFQPQSVIDGVRVLASRADVPYALPGEAVNVDLLVADGRPTQTRPLVVGWLPFLCVNPSADLYLACFAPTTRIVAANGSLPAPSPNGDGGAEADAGSPSTPSLPPGAIDFGRLAGTDITNFLVQGTRFSFTMPEDAIEPHASTQTDYGLVFLFNIACAGRVRIAALDPTAGQQQMPLECVDESGNALPASDYVVGFTRVYSYRDRRNQNPTISRVLYQGQPVDLATGITVPVCTKGRRLECDTVEVDIDSPPETQEEKTGEIVPGRGVPREQVYAQYYSTTGLFTQDARLLYDTGSGLVTDRAADLIPPGAPGLGRIYVVVKDDRGGTDWVDFPLRAE